MIYVEDIAAYKFWRSTRRIDNNPAELPVVDEFFDLPSSKAELDVVDLSCLQESTFDSRLHLVVPSPEFRISRSVYNYRVAPQGLPPRSFTQISEEICIANPALTLVQMSRLLPLPILAQAVDEMCGTYVTLPGSDAGYINDLPAITCPAQIQDLIECCKGTYATKRISNALKYCATDSASPKETELQLLLNLPTNCGGAGLPVVQMNPSFSVPEQFVEYLNKRTLRPDLYYNDFQLDIEYMSAQEHSGKEARVRDAKRKTVLEHMGFKIIEVWPNNIASASAVEQVVREIKKVLGLRYFEPSQAKIKKRSELIRLLRTEEDTRQLLH